MVDKIWDALINKMHVAIGSLWMIGLLIYRWKTGNDLGTGLTNATYAFFAFLAGHAFTYQKYPDQN